MLVFDQSKYGRRAHAQAPPAAPTGDLPVEFLRRELPRLPEVSELDALRHYTRLSQ
jgi:glycine dehydrogenase subunit 2